MASTPITRPSWPSAVKLLALSLIILGAKFCVMRACSTPLPFFDQWDGEGSTLLQPWLHGTLHWRDLFAFHVQHRIALTRLLVLGLFQANNGQWDTQVEMIAAAVFHALCAVGLGAMLIRRLGAAVEDRLLIVLALLFALPFDWENTLSGGFQSQFYFLLGLSFVAVWGLGTHRPGSAAWWTGVGAAILSWFSMASAPLAPLAVAGAAAWRRGPGDRVTLGTALALFAAGSCLNIGANPMTTLHPPSVGAFTEKFLGLLGWPNPTAWAMPLAYGPWLFLLARRFRSPDQPAAAGALLVPLGGFVVLQTAAIAYGRNQYHGLLVSRYMDMLSIGALVNFACLLQFAGERQPPRGRARLGILTAAWLGALGLGLSGLTTGNLDRDLPFIRSNNAREDANVAAFVAHPDPASLAGKHSFDYECDKPQLLTSLLQDPAMLAALPARARLPLALPPVQAAGRVSALVDAPPAPGAAPVPLGWTLEPPSPGEPATVFRSRTIPACLPTLEFSVLGITGPLARFALVGERTGRAQWISSPAHTAPDRWWAASMHAPSEPFHLDAVVSAGADAGGLKFLYPRESGRLSVWVDPVLDSACPLLFAGVALWLAAAFVTIGGRNFNTETQRTRSPEEEEEIGQIPPEKRPLPEVGRGSPAPSAHLTRRAFRSRCRLPPCPKTTTPAPPSSCSSVNVPTSPARRASPSSSSPATTKPRSPSPASRSRAERMCST